jgi:hypothetical protein
MRNAVGQRWRVKSAAIGVAAVAVVAFLVLALLAKPPEQGWVARGLAVLAMVMVLAVPFGLLVMMVVKVVTGAGRSRLGERREAEEREACPDCGQGIESQWESCPFCGAESLSGDDASEGRHSHQEGA